MASRSDNVVSLLSRTKQATLAERPFVETMVARQLTAWLTATNNERGIAVISGPWGIGKTTTLDHFVAGHWGEAVIVKVDPGSAKRGATPSAVLQLAIEALCPLVARRLHLKLNNAYWALRMTMHNVLCEWVKEFHPELDPDDRIVEGAPRFTFIFDEAQYLSREAIEMLRYWNDSDRTSMPFPVGLVFVGNQEFALGEDASGQSVLSGAVRSRALFR